jgi:hypothetical protein
MVSVALPLPRESTIGRDGAEANTRVVNAYAEALGADQDGKAPFVIYAAPGLTRWDTGTIIGPERGMIALDDSNMVALLGTKLCNITDAGVVTLVGAIGGTGRVTMARNLNGTPQIGIVTSDTQQYYLLQGGTLTQPSEANLPPPNSICYVRGYYVYSISDGRIFASPLDSGTGIDALSFDYANSEPDSNVRVVAHVGFLYIFGKSSLEIWQAAGTVPFPFGPIQQNIALGLLAPFSVTQTERGLIWVDHKGMVRFGRDGGAQRVSTYSVERAIALLSDADKAAIVGHIVTWQGHEYYVMSSPSWTWIFDTYAMRWYQRNSYGSPRWLVNDSVWFAGNYIVSSKDNGRLYKVDTENYSEDSTDYVMEVWCQNAHNFPNGFLVDALDIDIISGVGNNNSSNPADFDPQIMIDYSDDGGKTFSGERTMSLGKVGDFHKLVRTGRWGRVSQKGRIWRFRASAAVLRGIIQATIRGRTSN